MKFHLLCWFLLSSFGLIACNSYDENEKKLFDKIRPGMSEEEVVSILGKPDSRSYSIVDSGYTLSFFSRGKLWSTMPSVHFDSKGFVLWATYSESEYKNEILRNAVKSNEVKNNQFGGGKE